MTQANYAEVNPQPKVWGAKHVVTNELLKTSEDLAELRRVFAGDDYKFVKVPYGSRIRQGSV